MKKSQLILIGLAVVSVAFFFWALNRSSVQPLQAALDTGASQGVATSSAYEPKTSSDGWAEVEVLPLALASSEWSFQVNLNAHQEMNVDMTKAATLTDDRGDALTPLRWEEPNPGGHHQQGVLVFKAPASKPQSITLTLKDVGGAATRTFSWTLQ